MSKYMMKEKGDVILKKGDRVALIYPSQDPGAFAAALFACLFANLVPVPVEAPISNMVCLWIIENFIWTLFFKLKSIDLW